MMLEKRVLRCLANIGDEMSVKMMKLPFAVMDWWMVWGPKKESRRDVNRNKILGQCRKKRPLTVFFEASYHASWCIMCFIVKISIKRILLLYEKTTMIFLYFLGKCILDVWWKILQKLRRSHDVSDTNNKSNDFQTTE